MVEKKAKEEREVDRKQRKEELNFFKRTNQQLKSQIEAIMTPGKQEHFHPNFNINIIKESRSENKFEKFHSRAKNS